MIDCLLKDEKIHTDYKNSFKLVKDASFDEKIFKKKQNIPCIPRNDCSVCPKLSKGTPNSVRLNTNDNVKYLKNMKKSIQTTFQLVLIQVVIVVMIVNIDYLITHLMIN